MSKKCTPLWREGHFQVKMYKTHQLRTTFGSWDVEKVHAVVARSTCRSQNAHFEVKMYKAPHVRAAFGRSDAVSCSSRKGLSTLAKVSGQAWGNWRGSAKMHFPWHAQNKRHATCSSEKLEVRALISWEQSSYDLASFFLWQAQYFRQVEWKNRKTHWYEAVSSALNFLLLKAVSPNCFVFDVVNFENWGRLAEFLQFWCGQLEKLKKSRRLASFWRCQVQKLRKSCRIAAFLMLSSSKIEEVSQSSFVFKLQMDKQIDR